MVGYKTAFNLRGKGGVLHQGYAQNFIRELLAHIVDILADLGRQASLQPLKHLVECDQCADRLISQAGPVVDEHLVGLLNDRPRRSTARAISARLGTNARDDVDRKAVDMVGKIGVEVRERISLELLPSVGPLQSRVRLQSSLGLLKQRPKIG